MRPVEGGVRACCLAENNIPPEERVMGKGYYLRPNFVHFYKSKNIKHLSINIIK